VFGKLKVARGQLARELERVGGSLVAEGVAEQAGPLVAAFHVPPVLEVPPQPKPDDGTDRHPQPEILARVGYGWMPYHVEQQGKQAKHTGKRFSAKLGVARSGKKDGKKETPPARLVGFRQKAEKTEIIGPLHGRPRA
jgi:hypothetical protein